MPNKFERKIMPNIKKIREAVLNNCGGMEPASDQAIMIIWRSLPAETQKKYMETVTATTTTPAPREAIGSKTKN